MWKPEGIPPKMDVGTYLDHVVAQHMADREARRLAIEERREMDAKERDEALRELDRAGEWR